MNTVAVTEGKTSKENERANHTCTVRSWFNFVGKSEETNEQTKERRKNNDENYTKKQAL